MTNTKADTRAINIIIAGIIIFLIIAGFYVFLTKETIVKQKDAIRGSAGTIQADRLIAEWVNEKTEDLHSPATISGSFQKWFTEKGFAVGNIIGGNLQYQAPLCKGSQTIECNFALSPSKEIYPKYDYEKQILVPEKHGVRTIILKGKVTYE